ncbi:hypothetical protein FQR65_LT08235 [Abscondita terminalis]|nr:hypothetical protein FQR65_LT08235 [Abscondita terminalis]
MLATNKKRTQTNICDNKTNENLEDEVGTEEMNTPSQLEETAEQIVEDESYEIPTSLSLLLPNTPQSCSSSITNISRPVSRTASTKSATLAKKTTIKVKKTEAKKTESLPDRKNMYKTRNVPA